MYMLCIINNNSGYIMDLKMCFLLYYIMSFGEY